MPAPIRDISPASITNNRVILSNIFDHNIKIYFEEDQKWIIEQINEILTNNRIELIQNLKDEEITRLVKLFRDGLNVDRQITDAKYNFLQQAQLWVKSLVLAQPIQNQPNNIYATQKSITSELRSNKAVSLMELGADIDLKSCFGNEMLTNTVSVNGAGLHILPPSSLDSIVQDNFVKTSLENIKKKNINGDVSLRIPVNCNGNHWRLLKVEIKNEVITGVELWDPLSNDITNSIANLKLAVDAATAPDKITISVVSSGNQNNSHSCMDYVVQEIYKNKNVVNDIMTASSASELRLAITRQIAKSIPELDQSFTDNLKIVNGFVKSVVLDKDAIDENIVLDAEQQAFLKTLSTNADQVDFDNTLAIELDKLYKEDQCKQQLRAEDILLKNAQVRAFSIFKKAKAAAAVVSTVGSSSSPRNP